ncbi:fungal hydrophobin [Marasmius fiardii PR-910]|nr:fungal hydrophobin [Marasmius fiardii PR-910]
MFFNKFFALSALATLAAATAVPRTGGGGGGGGESGGSDVQCCQQTTQASDPAAAAVLGLLGIVLQDLNVLVGLNCSPITVIGGGNGPCSGTTVTCTDNSHGGLINIGCVPVTI